MAQTKIIGGGMSSDKVIQAGVEQAVDPQFLAGRIAMRPLDYSGFGSVLGHYRAIAVASGVNGLTAAQIIQSIRWNPPVAQFKVLTRYAALLEVLTAITTACVFDLQAFVFRGATGNASGTGSTTLTFGGNNQKDAHVHGSVALRPGRRNPHGPGRRPADHRLHRQD